MLHRFPKAVRMQASSIGMRLSKAINLAPPDGEKAFPKVPGLWDDIKIRIVLCLCFLIMAAVYGLRGYAYFKDVRGDQLIDLARLANGLSLVSIGIFALTVAVLYAIRRRPVNKLRGAEPTAIALLGAFLVLALPFLGRHETAAPQIKMASAILVVFGHAGVIFTLLWLGRSFSILPEARTLVTSGPYRFARHPMYTAEFVVLAGVLLNYLSLPAALASAVIVLCQLKRIRNEEIILRETFPGYEAYSRRTACLIPGVY